MPVTRSCSFGQSFAFESEPLACLRAGRDGYGIIACAPVDPALGIHFLCFQRYAFLCAVIGLSEGNGDMRLMIRAAHGARPATLGCGTPV